MCTDVQLIFPRRAAFFDRVKNHLHQSSHHVYLCPIQVIFIKSSKPRWRFDVCLHKAQLATKKKEGYSQNNGCVSCFS